MPSSQTAILQLCRLVSPALPVGAYAYSQGLESACEFGWVYDHESAFEWINGVLKHSLCNLDLPILLRLYKSWKANNIEEIKALSTRLLANRETSELRDEDRHLGQALARLLDKIQFNEAGYWRNASSTSYANLFALAAVKWKIDIIRLFGGLRLDMVRKPGRRRDQTCTTGTNNRTNYA